ncbi:FAD binding domain in molybdopterin dehydrogenase family protein [Mycobacterium kansasii]|uniref:FAD binding domain in molybdopterin dehydrogenase family protein n=1 Tax=Mycobacterium kansasii TaxID=1768 RepID=A0A1V3WRW0_MYCKA|nr:FAD binding domain in molybdopterin dehydrogenase family protein [Mycobacterium kansasii]
MGQLAELGEDAKILAGGQSLVPMLSMRLAYFDHLIDISRLPELHGIEARGDQLWIGAGTTEAVVGADAQVRQSVPLLNLATPFVGHFQIRNRGTLGGSIAHADAAGEYPAVALALDAVMEVLSPRGRREIAAADFFAGLWETTMEPTRCSPASGFRCGMADPALRYANLRAGTAISRSPGQSSGCGSTTMTGCRAARSGCWVWAPRPSARRRPKPRSPACRCTR